jgi:hypothetical protein
VVAVSPSASSKHLSGCTLPTRHTRTGNSAFQRLGDA